ncbi:MAG: hypothetical protein LBP35_04490 [Candidatus Ancillula trichonymphae]|jgi:hypothetical protein|nr:hypothetical protein [Candidatus Ancillula trichonymphae]
MEFWGIELGTSSQNRQTGTAEAKKTAGALKADGYEFASHSWGHIGFKVSTVQSVLNDDELWDKGMKPILGPTDLFVYPFGQDLAGVEEYSGAKFNNLYNRGFRYFANVDGSQPSWIQVHAKYVRGKRAGTLVDTECSTTLNFSPICSQFLMSGTKRVQHL